MSQLISREGFLDEPCGGVDLLFWAEAGFAGVTANVDNFLFGVRAANSLDQVVPVDVGKGEVDEKQIELLLRNFLQSFVPGSGFDYGVAWAQHAGSETS